ncbi:MAG: flavodoxin [Actinomycetales bacterium]|jgi:menaquinone-dependent protoporphyrinogen oxidase|nr:flavodoxin [Actinomycetales bacterium]
MAARVLVTYATRHGATKGIAQAVGSVLHSCGHQVRLLPAGVVTSADEYDVVVLGSAIYHDQWLWDGRRLAKRLRSLRGTPVWLFSSGPLGGTPEADAELERLCGLDTEPPWSVSTVLRGVDVRGHATFGGKLDPKVASGLDGYVHPGDWRDMAMVREWARTIGGGGVAAEPPREFPVPERGWGLSLGRV